MDWHQSVGLPFRPLPTLPRARRQTIRLSRLGAGEMKRAVLYLRVSTLDQTTANQERELREIAGRIGCEIVKVYKDHGISGAKGRDKRPAFDALCRAATRREFDMVMAWSVDRLGRSCKTWSPSCRTCVPSASTCSCISRGSTPLRRPVRRCFR